MNIPTTFQVLCLHGYRQNENMFREKTGGLRKAMKSRMEFGNHSTLIGALTLIRKIPFVEFLSATLTPIVDGTNGVDQTADQGET